MYRKDSVTVGEWLKSSNKALLVTGARQTEKTWLIRDEIQKCPEIVTKIKFLVDEGSFKYVMSGSLLGAELRGIASVPVGYLTVLRMYPMDFEEFMVANSVSKTTLDMLEEKYVRD